MRDGGGVGGLPGGVIEQVFVRHFPMPFLGLIGSLPCHGGKPLWLLDLGRA